MRFFRRLRDYSSVLFAPLVWRLKRGKELPAIPAEGDGHVHSLLVACLHSPGCWSYCTGGYRYCLCCMRVRVRC